MLADARTPEAGRGGCFDAQDTGYEDDSGKWSELSLHKSRGMHRLHHSSKRQQLGSFSYYTLSKVKREGSTSHQKWQLPSTCLEVVA
jgi:hypothetical protein